MARLYREAPINGIWEGTGNVVCLDVLRSIRKFPACVPAMFDELRSATGADRRYDAFIDELETDIVDVLRTENTARRLSSGSRSRSRPPCSFAMRRTTPRTHSSLHGWQDRGLAISELCREA